jgi:hypothetical protein
MHQQTSGSITLDTTSISAALLHGLRPAFDLIDERLAGISTNLLDRAEAIDVLGAHMGASPDDVIDRLAANGYRLVMVDKPLTALADRQAEATAREEAWFQQ